MRRQILNRFISVVVALPLLAVPSFGADSGGGGGGSSGQRFGWQRRRGGIDPVTCRVGLVYNPKTKKCEQPQEGMIYDDDSLYLAGRALARAGRFDEAIKLLTLARNKTDPRILNYLGYSHRKAGRVVVGLRIVLDMAIGRLLDALPRTLARRSGSSTSAWCARAARSSSPARMWRRRACSDSARCTSCAATCGRNCAPCC